MTILNITNLTIDPKTWIKDKFNDAFNELEKEFNITISDNERINYIDSQIENLEDLMNESKGSELISIIDNYLVNNDYYTEVKDYYTNLF